MAKIMLVEDDKSLREIYSVRLAAEGYEIISAGDGEEALAMAVKEKPDLILSDVMMPKISGFDMLDIIRATPETKDLKIIMMTALSSEDQRARGESLGANKYLVKSQVGIEDVVRAVHEVIGDIPIPVSPKKPVEFTKPIATENIETSSNPEVAPTTQEAATNEPTMDNVPQAPTPVPPPLGNQPTSAPPAPTPTSVPQESTLPQPTAPFSTAAPTTPPSETVETTPSISPELTMDNNQNQPSVKQEQNADIGQTAPEVINPVTPEPTPIATEPVVEMATQAPTPVSPPLGNQPTNAPPAPTPTSVPQESTLPQPTAPFSTAAPHSSLGERIINPLNSIEDKPDISSLINQELNNSSNNTPPQNPQV